MTTKDQTNGVAELLERVKAATGPDRGLDGLIARDLEGWVPHFALKGDELTDWPDMGGHWHLPDDPDADDCQRAPSNEPPPYTVSIEAALTLAERMLPCVGIDIHSQCGDGTQWQVMLTGDKFCVAGLARSFPLAILAALLSALIAKETP